MSEVRLLDRTVIVAGAGRGLGHAMALGLCTAGAQVVATARTAEAIGTLADTGVG